MTEVLWWIKLSFTAKAQQPDTCGDVQKLWAEGGAGRFYKGFTPCLLRAFPANGIMLLTVDTVNLMLND